MLIMHQYPYSNFHDLNLDYILDKISGWDEKLTNFVSLNTVKYANPFDWSITSQYEQNTIVFDPDSQTAYLSVQPVPAGVDIKRAEYWTPIFTLDDIYKGLKNAITTVYTETGSPVGQAIPEGSLVWFNADLYTAVADIPASAYPQPGDNLEKIDIRQMFLDIFAVLATETAARVQGDTTNANAITEAKNSISELDAKTQQDIANLNNKIDATASPWVPVSSFGAVGDGVTDDTAAIQQAFNSGKPIVFDGSKTYLSGSLTITDASGPIDFANCTIKKNTPFALINADSTNKRTIANVNFIDTNSTSYKGFILAREVSKLTIKDIKITTWVDTVDDATSDTAGNWCITLSGTDIVVDNVIIDGTHGRRYTDGIHVGYFKNLIINNVNIQTGDDCIALLQQQSLTDDWGTRFKNLVSENAIITNAIVHSRTANGFKFGSFTNNVSTYDNASIKNVHIDNMIVMPGSRAIKLDDPRTTVTNKYTDIKFTNCIFDSAVDTTSYSIVHIAGSNQSANLVHSIAFDGCTFTRTATSAGLDYMLFRRVDRLQFTNNTIKDPMNGPRLIHTIYLQSGLINGNKCYTETTQSFSTHEFASGLEFCNNTIFNSSTMFAICGMSSSSGVSNGKFNICNNVVGKCNNFVQLPSTCDTLILLDNVPNATTVYTAGTTIAHKYIRLVTAG